MQVILPWPPKELSPNARLHWTKVSKAKKAYRDACYYLALQAGAKSFKASGKVAIDLTFYPPDRRHRDDDNMLAAMKAGRDGLADALGVNDHKFKTSFEVAEEIGNFVRVEVRAIELQEGNPHEQDRRGQ